MMALNITKFSILIALSAIVLYYYDPNIFQRTKDYLLSIQNQPFSSSSSVRLFTATELAKYDSNENSEEIYLSILGSVYDVTKGKKHYGLGCTYGFFTGKDASASFISGNFEDFTPDSDDVAQLEPSSIESLFTWKKFYEDTYVYKGRLIGRFYDKHGAITDYYRKVEALAEVAKNKKANEKLQNDLFPPCNIEWAVETGTRVWCSTQSGGIKRDWIGVPRKYFQPGQESFRCACVKPEDLTSPLLKSYDDCNPDSLECFYEVS